MAFIYSLNSINLISFDLFFRIFLRVCMRLAHDEISFVSFFCAVFLYPPRNEKKGKLLLFVGIHLVERAATVPE